MRGQRTYHGRRRAAVRSASLAVAVLATVGSVRKASAVPNDITFYTAAGSGNWFDAGNWSSGVPSAQDQVRVTSSATISINGAAQAAQMFSGYGDNVNPTFNLAAGASLTNYNVQLALGGTGAVAGSNNNLTTFNQTGGAVTVQGQGIPLYVGYAGSAIYNMSGGTVDVSGPQYVSTGNLGIAIGTGTSAAATNSGTLNLSAGTITTAPIFQVARQGATGTVNMTGGAINVGTDVWIGQGNTTSGGGGLATITQSAGTFSVGYNAFGQSNFGNLYLGVGNVSTKRSTYTLSGTGAIQTQGAFYAGGGFGGTISTAGGVGGYGDYVMNGGTLSIGGVGQTVGGGMHIGHAFGTAVADGTVTLNAGTITMNVPGSVIAVGSYQGDATVVASLPAQSGTLTITGGQLLASKSVLAIGQPSALANSGATGTVNLSGTGELSIDSLQWKNSNANVRTFNWTGGTLDINSQDSDYVLTNAGGTLRPGGANINTFTAASTSANGSYTQTSGTLALDLASNAFYDAIDLSAATVGAATLSGGTVQVTALGTYAPAFGASIPAIAAKTISDAAAWTLPTLPAGNTWDRRISTDGANQVETLVAVRSSASTATTSGSNWTTAGWDAGTPNATDASAKLAGAGGSITLDAPIAVGYLQLDGTSGWTVNGSNALTIATSGATGGIIAFGGAHTISAPVQFSSNAAIGTQLKSTSVTLSGDISGAGIVEKTGPGSLALSSVTSPFTGTWSISGGSLNIDSDANLGAAAASIILANGTVNSTGAWNSTRAIALTGSGGIFNPGADSTLSGVISGAGGVTLIGPNALVLAGANTYSGATTVNAGVLRQGAANAIPASSAVTIATGASVDLNSNAASVLSLSGAGNVINSSGGLTVGSSGLSTTSATLTGTVTGGGAFTKAGPGTQVLTSPVGANFLTAVDGPITVNGGTLQITGLLYSHYDLPASDINVASGATIALGGTGTGALVFSAIHGAGSLAVVGGNVSLTVASDNTGGTTLVNAPNLTISDMGALGSAGTPIHFVASGTADRGTAGHIIFSTASGGGLFSHPILVDAYKFAFLDAQGQTITLDQPITGGGGFQWGSGLTGAVYNLNAANTYNGTMNVDPNVTIIQGVDNALPANAPIAVNGTVDLNNHNLTLNGVGGVATGQLKLTGGNLTIASNFDFAYAGIITGTGGVTKTGGGTETLSLASPKSNSYTGPTAIQQGALQISGNINALSPATAVTISSGASLIFAATAVGSGLTAGTPVTYSGAIAGGGEVQLNDAAAESLVLNGANTYSGGTRIAQGTLLVSADSNLGAAAGPVTFFGFSTTPVLKYSTGFSSTRNVVLENLTGAIDTNGNNATLGNIAGVGGFQKKGAGTLTVNSIRAGLALDVAASAGGTLQIAPSGGASSGTSKIAGAVTVGAGSKLDLTDNKLITSGTVVGTWNGSAYTGVTGLIKAGRNGGAWNGSGIITSMTDATSPSTLTTLAVASAGDVKGITGSQTATFGGLTVSPTDTLVMYTYAGDANLSGGINGDDYFRIDSGYAAHATGYSNGDFNYDGRIDADDYFIIDSNYSRQGAAFPASSPLGGVSAVPEPGSMGLILVAASLAARRRRRRS